MALFKFIGDPNDGFSGPQTIDILGYLFHRNAFTEVDAKTAMKLRGNNHFEEKTHLRDPSIVDRRVMPTVRELVEIRKRGWPKGKPRGPRRVTTDENA